MYPKMLNNTFVKITPQDITLSAVINGTRSNIKINESAFNILKLCTGNNTITDIYTGLNEIYDYNKDYVDDFINKLVTMGIIGHNETKEFSSNIKGNKNFFLPNVLIWEITNKCPLNCLHCYLGKKESKEISLKDIDRIIEIIIDTGVSTVQITGGEIFTHPLLKYIIDKLSNLNIRVSLSTSGFLLDDNVKEILQKIKTDFIVRVSLDGDREYHNKIRKNNKSFDKCIEFMNYLKKESIECQVGTVLLEQSESMLKELIILSKSLGVTLHTFSPASRQGNALSNNMNSNYSYGDLHSKLKLWSELYNSDKYKIQLPQESEEINCGCGHKVIRLRPDLSITPCPMIDYEIGNLGRESYEDIMRNGTEIFSQIYSPKSKNATLCKSCGKNNECSECIASAFTMENNTNSCQWYKTYLQEAITKNQQKDLG